MIYSLDTLESKFNNLLQSEITISLNDKVLREGKLILFSIKNFYLTFNLACNPTSTRLVYYELPSPFSYEVRNKSIKLSYKLKHFHQDNADILVPMQLLGKSKLHKIYDKEILVNIKY